MLEEIQKALPDLTEHDYNRLVWLFDHIYIPPQDSSAEDEAHAYKKTLLENAGIGNGILYEAGTNVVVGSGSDIYYIDTTDEELDDIIDVVQQMVIWNIIGDYSDNSNIEIHRAEQGSLTYRDFTEDTSFLERIGDVYGTRQFGEMLNEEVTKLYQYLVTESDRQADRYDGGRQNVTFQTTVAEVVKEGSNYIVGPFRLEAESDIEYTLELTVTNNGSSLTNYTLLNSSKNPVSAGTEIKDLVGSNFYLSIPDTVDVGRIRLTVNGTYYGKKVTYWTVSGSEDSEQPIVIIEEGNNDFSDSTEIEYIPEYFDLSLRKFITAINGVNLSQSDTRIPNIDISPLNDGDDENTTTAEYRHPKDPIQVNRNDIVTYTIRVYNEGDIDGYVDEITDHLPEQLEFIEGDSLNTSYGWELQSDGRTVTTDITSLNTTHRTEQNNLYGSRTNGTLLKAFDGSNLDYIEVQIKCRVKNTDFTGVITNIAQITDFSDENGDEIEDRDSQENNLNLPSDTNLPDYKGNTSNKNDLTDSNYHYEGQEDDDDFEKLILPAPTGSYNLQLLKVDSENENTKLEGAVFKVTLPDGTERTVTTEANGMIDLGQINIEEAGTDVITIEEQTPPTGYDKLFNRIEITVTKELGTSGGYNATEVEITDTEGTEIVNGETVKVSLSGGVVTVTIPNKKQVVPEGNYKLQLTKVDSADEDIKLEGAEFKVTLPDGTEVTKTTDANGMIDLGQIDIEEIGTDVITIEEITEPTGYDKLFNSIEVTVTKELTSPSEYNATRVEITNVDGTEIVNGEEVKVDLSEGVVTVTVPNKKEIVPEGNYKLQLVKVDSTDENIKLEGAEFKVTLPDGTEVTETTDANGMIDLGQIDIEEVGTDVITIEEITEPTGYDKLFNSIEVTVTKELTSPSEYNATRVEITNVDGTEIVNGEEVKVDLSGGVVTVTVPNKKEIIPEGNYKLQLVKVDSTDENIKLEGAEFKITLPDGTEVTETTDANGMIDLGQIDIEEIGTDVITIEEITAPTGYDKLFNRIEITVTKELTSESEYNATRVEITNVEGTEIVNGEEVKVSLSDKTVTVTVPNKLIKKFDLSLRKFITSVNGEDLVDTDGSYTREPEVDVGPLVDGNEETTTAIYNHPKTPVEVELGDTVTYTIRVYNEGEVDGYVREITDHLPPQLEYLPDDELNLRYGWVLGEDGRTVTTDITSPDTANVENQNAIYANRTTETDKVLLKAFDGSNLDYIDVQIRCRVKRDIDITQKITNIAEITESSDSEGEEVPDIDSDEDNVDLPSDEDLPGYKDEDIESGDEYIPGQEDDDDFEKLIPKEEIFDLSLRKFITSVNENELVDADGSYTREPEVDVGPLVDGSEETTTAIYNHQKTPVEVNLEDIVTYTIRVYNEGEIDGYVREITDHLPPQLEYLPDDELNIRYGWVLGEDGRTVTTDITSPDTANVENQNEIYANRTTETDKVLLKAFDGSNLDYIDVQIRCRVRRDIDITQKITNIAEITGSSDSEGEEVPDIDSDEDNVDLPSDEDLPEYKDEDIESGDEYIPGQEDDDDFEKLIPKIFDLALRKFITGVNDQEITNRVPIFTIDENGNYVYEHTKEPVEVATGYTVIYTLRIFNEGNVAGYAELVKDDIPEGLEFLPENEINIENRWKMYREDGTETDNPSEARYIETDYLSKAQEEETGRDNLLDAFNPEEMTQPDYRDIRIAFRVTEPNTSDRIIINSAQISEDSDEEGNPVEDEDSEPDEWNEGEDDQDIEKIKVQYYDMALRKWVTESIVTYNGKTTVTQTGHTAYMDPESPAKVEIRGSRMENTTVKFRFSIMVVNEGEIAGKIGEITDYIPEGLRFVQEDNPEWREVGENIVVTNQLKDTVLEPGESATVEIVLTWISSKENLGLMTNWAEISEDDGDDIDSTPDNREEGEDDIDSAPVIISIVTGATEVYTYIGLAAGVLAILSGGVILIKKFVI